MPELSNPASPVDAGEDPDHENASADAAAGEAAPPELTLSEALLMLALGDEDGQVHRSAHKALPFGLAGAVLLVLASRGRLRHEDEVWKVTDATPTGDPALDPALAAMADEEEPQGTLHWLRTLPEAGATSFQQRLLHGLVERNVLNERKRRFLGLVPYRRYPTADPDPERRVRAHVRRVVLEGQAPDDRTRVLLALLKACDLTGEVFTPREQRDAADRLDALAEEQHAARGVSEVPADAVRAVLNAASTATAAATLSLSMS